MGLKPYDWTPKINFKPFLWKIRDSILGSILSAILITLMDYSILSKPFILTRALSTLLWAFILLYVLFSIFPGKHRNQ